MAYAWTTLALGVVFVPVPVAALLIGTTPGLAPATLTHTVGLWGVHALILASALLITRYITCRLGITIRDLGVAPVWARSDRLLVRMDYQHQALLVFGVAAGGFWVARALTFLPDVVSFRPPEPVSPGQHLAALALLGPVQIAVAVVVELVLVGLLVTLFNAGNRPAWQAYAVSTLARVAIGATVGWQALTLAPLGLLLVWLYRRTGRLTPIIAAHATGGLLQTAVAVWVAWVSGTVYPPTSRLLILPLL